MKRPLLIGDRVNFLRKLLSPSINADTEKVNSVPLPRKFFPHRLVSLLRKLTMSPLHASAFLLLPLFLFAVCTGRAEAAAFEPLGFGAAAKGMGGAYSAAGRDAEAIYWNPAALGLTTRVGLMAGHEDLFGLGLVRYATFGAAVPRIGLGSVGLALLRLDTTGDANFLDYAETTYIVSYGQQVAGPLYGGANVRYYHVSGIQGAGGFGVDTGFLAHFPETRLDVGFVVQEINQPRIRWGTGTTDELPRTVRLGAALGVSQFSLVALEGDWRGKESPVFHAGTAVELLEHIVIVRAGLVKPAAQATWNVTGGGGVRVKWIEANYAIEHRSDLGNTQSLSVSIRF